MKNRFFLGKLNFEAILVICFIVVGTVLSAQIQLTTDRPNASYQPGETAYFILTSNTSGTATYNIVYDNFAPIITSGSIAVSANTPVSIPYTHTEAGIVLCKVNLGSNNTVAAAAFAIDQIQPMASAPSDFDAFWENAKAELAAVPIDPVLSDCQTNTYETTCRINLGNIDGRRVYGYISVPSTPGPYPAMLTLPPYGAGPNVCTPGDFNAVRAGMLSISINIHDAEPDISAPGAYSPDVITNPDSNYYKYAVLAAIRAIDYIYSRPDFNGTEMGVMGVSQGGGLSYLVAGIDSRVNLLLNSVAALSEHNGLANNRASGFPYYVHQSRTQVGTPAHEAATLVGVSYYDAVHAAARYEGPTWAFLGYEDLVCPAATGMAAFNQLSGPKIMTHSIDLGHNTPAPYWNDRTDFFRRHYPSTATPPWPWPGTTTGYFVNAGDDVTIDITATANLSATVEFNTTVNPNWPKKWMVVSGTGSVSFSNPESYITTATFTEPGTYTLQFTAYDYGELATQKRFTSVTDQVVITVIDNNIPPEVTLSSAMSTVNAAFDVQVQFSKIVTGLSTSDFVINNGTATNLSGAGSQYVLTVSPTIEGLVQISLPAGSAQDNNGNPSNASNLLSVLYEIPQGLFLTCPQDITLPTLPGAATVQVNYDLPVVTTSCTPQTIDLTQTSGLSGGAEFPIGTTTNSFMASDNCGNIENCSFIVTVNQVPAVLVVDNCPSNMTVFVDEGLGGQTINWTVPSGSSNCYLGNTVNVVQINGPATGSFLSLGEHIIAYELTDLCGETEICTFVIEVIESIGTIAITCPEDINIMLGQNESAVAVSWELPVVSSTCMAAVANPNCGTVPSGFSFVGTFNDHEYLISNNTVTWSAAEATCANYGAHLATINDVAENEFIKSNITAIAYIGINDAASEGSLVWNSNDPVGYTNFKNSNVNTATKDYGAFQPWNGKWDMLSSSVWKNYLMELDCGGGAALELTQIDGPAPGSLLTAGTYTVIYEATDGCGDLKVCSFNITIAENNQTLSINCPASVTMFETPGTGEALVTFNNPTVSTSCSNNTIDLIQTGGLVSGSLFPIGNTTITFEASDACGDLSTCSFIVTVLPEPPSGDYCTASASAPWQQWIGNVQFNTINNSSFKEGYGNFTALSTAVDRNAAYNFTLTPAFSWAYSNQYVRVWIDYNHNLDFNDPGELVLEQISTAGTPPYPPTIVDQISGTISIPASALLGNTRMRVAMKKDAYPGSCENFGEGEVEDYTIVINGAAPPDLQSENVEVLFFQAGKAGREVPLSWVSNAGYKTDHFVLERSMDGVAFQHLAIIENQDDSDLERLYQFTDKAPFAGSNFYRLQQIHKDGSRKFADIRRVDFDLDLESVVLFPNPTTTEIFTNLSAHKGFTADLQICNSLGQPVLTRHYDALPVDPIRFDLVGKAPGVYYLTIKLKDKKSVTQRFIVVQQ